MRIATISLIVYAAAVILIPPIKFHEKNYFFAEILLIPFFGYYSFLCAKKQVAKPDLKLVFLVGALVLAFLSGMFRGRFGYDITVYYWTHIEDAFSWKVDGTRFLRWLALFLTPFIIGEVFKKSRTVRAPDPDLIDTFINWTIALTCISSILSILDHFNIMKLANYYPFPRDDWEGRSYGTFASPLEAALVYGAASTASLQHFFSSKRISYLIGACLTFGGLIFTQSATGLAATALTLGYFVFKKTPGKTRQIILIAAPIIILVCSLWLPHLWTAQKLHNFWVRTQMWRKWGDQLPAHPWLAVTGMGFTALVADNSFVLLLIHGGLILFAAFFVWFWQLLKDACNEEILPFLMIWIFSWMSLDSIGYWGISRLCWFLMGLALASRSPHFRNVTKATKRKATS